MTENNYRIIRKTGFSRIVNGKLQGKEHEARSFNGLWDEQKRIIQITQNGIILIFQPGNNRLKIENSTYTKL